MPQTHPKGFFKDVGHWIKKHPLASAIIGVFIGVLVYLVVTNSQSQAGSSDGTTPPGNYVPDVIINNIPPSPPGTSPPPGLPPTKPPIKPPKKHKHKHKHPRREHPPIVKGTTHTTIHSPASHGFEPGHRVYGMPVPAHTPPPKRPKPPALIKGK